MDIKTGFCCEDYIDYFANNKQISPAINRQTGKRKISIEYWTPNRNNSILILILILHYLLITYLLTLSLCLVMCYHYRGTGRTAMATTRAQGCRKGL